MTTDQHKINQLQVFCKANRQPQRLENWDALHGQQEWTLCNAIVLPSSKIGNNKNRIQRGNAQPFPSKKPTFWKNGKGTKIDEPKNVLN